MLVKYNTCQVQKYVDRALRSYWSYANYRQANHTIQAFYEIPWRIIELFNKLGTYTIHLQHSSYIYYTLEETILCYFIWVQKNFYLPQKITNWFYFYDLLLC